MISRGTRIDKYLVGHQIGEGGISDVFEASDESLYGRKVAVKALKAIYLNDSDSLARFKKEIEILSSLHHSNIMEIREAGTFQSTPYLIAELLEGQDVKQNLMAFGPMSPDLMANIILQVLNALQYAHDKGIWHRDIKPANIFLNRNKLVKLLDFGIAKDSHLPADISMSSEIMGSPPFMSPEQITHSSRIDQRSDLYSLGVTLFTMIEGEHPYVHASSIFEMQGMITKQPLPRLSRCFEFQSVIDKATEKIPSKRYQSAEEFKLDFIAAFNLLLDTNRTNHTKLRKKLRRKKLGSQLVSTKAMLVLFMLGVALAASFFLHRKLSGFNSNRYESTPATGYGQPSESEKKQEISNDTTQITNEQTKSSSGVLTDDKMN